MQYLMVISLLGTASFAAFAQEAAAPPDDESPADQAAPPEGDVPDAPTESAPSAADDATPPPADTAALSDATETTETAAPLPQAAAPTAQVRQPKKLNPVHGHAPPDGYYEVLKPHRGLLISGAVITGLSYGFALMVAGASKEAHFLTIPLAGPMIWGFRMKKKSCGPISDLFDNDCEDGHPAYAYYGIMWSVVQTTGVALRVASAFVKKKMWLRQDVARVKMHFQPVVGAGTGGLVLSGLF